MIETLAIGWTANPLIREHSMDKNEKSTENVETVEPKTGGGCGSGCGCK